MENKTFFKNEQIDLKSKEQIEPAWPISKTQHKKLLSVIKTQTSKV